MELKEIVETLGFKADQFKTVDEFKSEFEKSFIRASALTEDNELVKPIIGKVFGSIENDLKSISKKYELDIDFNDADFKDKKLKHKLDIFSTKISDKYNSQINELKESVGKGSDEKIKEYELKLTKEQQKRKDAEALLNSTKNEYEQFKENTGKDFKNIKLNIIKKDAFSKLKLKPEITEIEKRGFNSYINENYDFDIDEDDSPIVKDKKGNRIPSSKVVGTYKTIDEILEEEAVKNKVFAVNMDAGKPKPKATPLLQNNQQPQNTFGARKIAPKLG